MPSGTHEGVLLVAATACCSEDSALATSAGVDTSSARIANRAAVDARVAAEFAANSAPEIKRRLIAAGTAFGHVNDSDGLARHPGLRRLSVAVQGG